MKKLNNLTLRKIKTEEMKNWLKNNIILIFVVILALLTIIDSINKESFLLILPVLAIILSILALMPYLFEILFYFMKKPRFKIQIANKKLTKRGKERIFDFWLGIQSENVSILINKVILSLLLDMKPLQHPDSSRKIMITPTMIEGAEFGPTILLDEGELPCLPKSGNVYLIRIVIGKKLELVNATLMIESEVDSLKLGFWSIFYNARRYRKQKELKIKTNSERQKLLI